MNNIHKILVVLVSLCSMLVAMPSHAQFLALQDGTSESPIDIEADDGIEWLKDIFVYRAQGNVIITQDDLTIKADIIELAYKETDEGPVYQKLSAKGHVFIQNGHTHISGERAYWLFDDEIFYVQGKHVTYSDTRVDVTATKDLQYWQLNNKATIQGNVVIIDSNQRLEGDTVDIFFDANHEIKRFVSNGDVRIINQQDIITGDKLNYNIANDEAEICGDAIIKREGNLLQGDCAIMQISTGNSSLKGAGNNRVKVRIGE